MARTVCAAVVLLLLGSSKLAAQGRVSWQVRGDTLGAPRGCSAAAALAALERFIDAMNTADSVKLTSALALKRPLGYVYSVRRFVPAHKHVSRGLLTVIKHFAFRIRRHKLLNTGDHSRVAIRL